MRVVLAFAVIVVALAAGCGGSGDSVGAEKPAVVETVEVVTDPANPAPAGSLRALLGETPGEDVALVFGTADFAVGENRVTFLVISSTGELVEAPRARVLVAEGDLNAAPTLEASAENLPVGATEKSLDDDGFDAPTVWVAHLKLDRPGRYSLLVEPEGTDVQAVGEIDVREKSAAPGPGAKAFPSDTPTLEDGFPDEITTATPPDTELLRYSVKESIEDGVPFVVTFATPKYCQSRVCGPVVDVVDEVRRRLEGSGIRFIHVEIFEGNDPSKGYNRWVREWNLPSEPYTFLVDATGTIQVTFEGLVTASELEQAVRDKLL